MTLIILKFPVIDIIVIDKVIINNFNMITMIRIRIVSGNEVVTIMVLILVLATKNISLETSNWILLHSMIV